MADSIIPKPDLNQLPKFRSLHTKNTHRFDLKTIEKELISLAESEAEPSNNEVPIVLYDNNKNNKKKKENESDSDRLEIPLTETVGAKKLPATVTPVTPSASPPVPSSLITTVLSPITYPSVPVKRSFRFERPPQPSPPAVTRAAETTTNTPVRTANGIDRKERTPEQKTLERKTPSKFSVPRDDDYDDSSVSDVEDADGESMVTTLDLSEGKLHVRGPSRSSITAGSGPENGLSTEIVANADWVQPQIAFFEAQHEMLGRIQEDVDRDRINYSRILENRIKETAQVDDSVTAVEQQRRMHQLASELETTQRTMRTEISSRLHHINQLQQQQIREQEKNYALVLAQEEARRQRELEEQRRKEAEERKRQEVEVARKAKEAAELAEKQRIERESKARKEQEEKARLEASRASAAQPEGKTEAKALAAGAAGSGHGVAGAGDLRVSEVAIKEAEGRLQILERCKRDAEIIAKGPEYRNLKLTLMLNIGQAINQLTNTDQGVAESLAKLRQAMTEGKQAHPAGLAYVCKTIADKLLEKAEASVSKHQSSAYALAYLTYHTCVVERLFLDLVLASWHERCVYTIPRYFSRRSFETVEKFRQAMNFKEAESEESYSERMIGLMSYYAAFVQIDAPQHPHGLPAAWRWIARICNQEPHSGTAAVLHAFLAIAGFQMHKTYRRQFHKLLLFLHQDYIKRLPTKTPVQRAARDRLVLFLETYQRSGFQITEPEGHKLERTQRSDATKDLPIYAGDYNAEG